MDPLQPPPFRPGASWRLLDDPDGTITPQGREVGAADLAGAFVNGLHADSGDLACADFRRAMSTLERAAAQTATGRDHPFLFEETGAAAPPPPPPGAARSATAQRDGASPRTAPMAADCGCSTAEPWLLRLL